LGLKNYEFILSYKLAILRLSTKIIRKDYTVKIPAIDKKYNIYRLAEELKFPERRIIDFSNPSNPLGISRKIKAELRKNLKYLHNYPDPDASRLRKRLSQYLGINPEMLIFNNSSFEFIYFLFLTLKPSQSIITLPNHPEYENISRICAIPSSFIEINKNIDLLYNHSIVKSSIIIISNPNYPSGLLLNKDIIIKLADTARKNNCFLIIDEAFMDFCQNAESVISYVKDNKNLCVLRTFSYFYCLAGLRAGYAVIHPEVMDKLKLFRNFLIINHLAQRAAVIAIKDKIYKKESYLFLEKEKIFFEKAFTKLGLDFSPSNTNYYLIKSNNAEEIYIKLMNNGILTGTCLEYKSLGNNFLRIAVKSHRENSMLIKELQRILG
jgi:threonine-phosphate decarboxylase